MFSVCENFARGTFLRLLILKQNTESFGFKHVSRHMLLQNIKI